MKYRLCLLLIGLLFLFEGCASASTVAQPHVPVATATFTPPAGTNCLPPSPLESNSAGGFPEVQGAASGGQLWGLIMANEGLPLQASSDIKIVWRMTGSGSLTITTFGPNGATAPLTFGREEHSSSNYDRPGDEWGTGFDFPVAGCWQIHAARGDLAGDVWLLIE